MRQTPRKPLPSLPSPHEPLEPPLRKLRAFMSDYEPKEDQGNPAPPGFKYDVVIYDVVSGIISSIADFNLSPESAIDFVVKLERNLVPQKGAYPIPTGTKQAGMRLPMTPFREARLKLLGKKARPLNPTLRAQRLADSQCINCGSPQLETETHCAQCLPAANESSKIANRKARGFKGIIG